MAIRMQMIAFAVWLMGCSGSVDAPQGVGFEPRVVPAPAMAPACFETEYGCSFCVPDASPGSVGNIGRFVDGGVEYGSCLGATPFCVKGDCSPYAL